MSGSTCYTPLSSVIPDEVWPKDLFDSDNGTFLDGLACLVYDERAGADTFNIYVQARVMDEVRLRLPFLDGISLVLGKGDGTDTGLVDVGVRAESFPDSAPTLELLASTTVLSISFDRNVLMPVEMVQEDGKLTAKPLDGNVTIPLPFALRLSYVNDDWSFEFDVPGGKNTGLSIPTCMIGDTGIVFEASDFELNFSGSGSRPAGSPPDWKGIYLGQAKLYVPELFNGSISVTDLGIGTGGVYGTISSTFALAYSDSPTPHFTGDLATGVSGLPGGIGSISLAFTQNALTAAAIKGQILLPYFDQPVEVDLGIDSGGKITVNLLGGTGGLVTLTKPGVLAVELDSLGFELKNGVFLAKLSGKITPLVGGVDWPSFDVKELAIDSKGNVQLTGGWIDLPSSYTIDFYGAILEITKFGIGNTADGGKYIGMSGAVELVKGLPAGASVDGLRIAWYPNGNAAVSFNGIGLSFSTPAVEFTGAVSYSDVGGNSQFKGDLKLILTACELTLMGKCVFGKDQNGVKYFAIFVEGDFGTGFPLFATGISLYGFQGLLAINYAPARPASMLWFDMNKANSWFHKPQIGVTDIIRKWGPKAGAFAVGAGVDLGTEADDGYSFNGKFLLLVLCPGPVLMIDGSAAFLRKRTDTSEPPFHGLIVLDTVAGYFLVGLDAHWKSSQAQGEVADISGSMEVYFNYFDPSQWHLWLGKDTPMAERIQARLAKVFTANAYFMLDGHGLKVGGWIGTNQNYNWGPVSASMNAWLAADADVNFKPPQLHVDIHLHGQLALKVFGLSFGICLDAILTTDVFKPFHIKGELQISVQTCFKNFNIDLTLEWGPYPDKPVLDPAKAPELAPVQSYGIVDLKSSTVWPLSGAAALTLPKVSVASCPYVTFAFPMNDTISVGVNPVDPGWMTIGDPGQQQGSARVMYSLTGIQLLESGNTVAACPKDPKYPNIPLIYGSWSPSIPGAAGKQNKLLLGSANPLDFADKSGSWNPWLSSNLPGYPCADLSTETVCADFSGLSIGQQLYGTWWDPQNPDFQFSWSDAWPRPIVAMPGPVPGAVPVQGLLFAASSRAHYRAYVANAGGNAIEATIAGDSVSVVDLVTRQVTDIAGGLAPSQVALYGNSVLVSNRGDNTVSVIDTNTNLVTNTIKVNEQPAAIAISALSKRAFVPSGNSATMSVIDLTTATPAVTQVATQAAATRAVVTPDGKKLYLIHADQISVLSADSATPIASTKTIKTIPYSGGGAMVMNPAAGAHTAWVSFPDASPDAGAVLLFDTAADAFGPSASMQLVGGGTKDLAMSLDGKLLYAGNVQGNSVSVLNTTGFPTFTGGGFLTVVATIPTPTPAGLQITPDGSALLVANTTTNTIAIIDTATNQIVGSYIAAGQQSNSFAVQLVAQPSGSTQVTINVPPGSSSVEVTWNGSGSLTGTVTQPAVLTMSATVVAGTALTLTAPLSSPGIDQITLTSAADWTLIRVCVTRLKLPGGLASQTKMNAAANQQFLLSQQGAPLLDPGKTYELHVHWSATVQGLGDLAGWTDSFNDGDQTVLKFQTAFPPSLDMVTDPKNPTRIPPEGTGLLDLSLYVAGTIPATITPAGEVPKFIKPIYRGYDVSVDFNETYVDKMYTMAGRNLDLILFDRNNQPVTDLSGQLMIVEDAWGDAPTLTLTDTQARWIDMFNANTCTLQKIDLTKVAKNRVLSPVDDHVLPPGTVCEARLVPELMYQLEVATSEWPVTAGASIFNPGPMPVWKDYRLSMQVALQTSDAVGVLFSYTNASNFYQFTMDPVAKQRRLTQTIAGVSTTIAEDFFAYSTGVNYRIRIQAIGSQILVSQDFVVVFTVNNATALTGTVGLLVPATQKVFDIGVSDLSTSAPVAYRFQFTTSEFTNFYHQIHSFQDEVWEHVLGAAPDLTAAVYTGATVPLPISDAEARAYDALATLVLGTAAAQDPPQLDVTRLHNVTGNAVFNGWLLTSPEPIDWTRTALSLSAATPLTTIGETPGGVKISEAEIGDVESVTLLARETADLSGYRVQYRRMPAGLQDDLSGQSLWSEVSGVTAGQIVGDQTWSDYRASTVCHASQTGAIGIQFRYVDAQNYYAFTYDFVSGAQQITKTLKGVTSILTSAPGDPAPGIPAPAVLLTVSVQGKTITAYRAEKLVLTVGNDTDLPVGGAGTFVLSNLSAQFDSFEVHRLPNEMSAPAQSLGPLSTANSAGWPASSDGLLCKSVGASFTDAILRARVQRITPVTSGILLRYQDAANHYRFLFTNQGLRLDRLMTGSVTTLWSSTAFSPALNALCELTVSVIGSAIAVFQDGVPVCEVVDATFASGSFGFCAASGGKLEVWQAIVYPADLAFSNWTARDQFQQLSKVWSFVDAGDTGGPSNWQVASGLLTQTSGIHDSTTAGRGTIALLAGSTSTNVRVVTRLLPPKSGAMGVVFGYLDANNFWRFSMDFGASKGQLESWVNGKLSETLPTKLPPPLAGQGNLLVLDLIDGYVRGWVDGTLLFTSLAPAVDGLLGLYCSGAAGASFADFRVGAPQWCPYYTFGSELPIAAGNRVKIVSTRNVLPAISRTSFRVAAELDDPTVDFLPPSGARLQVVAADKTVVHGRQCLPGAQFAPVSFRAMRKGDGTGIFLAPISALVTMRLQFRYQRNGTEGGDASDEIVFIDLPTNAAR